MRKKLKIAVLETGHILEGQVSSGDRWLEDIFRQKPPKDRFFIIIPKIGVCHWQESGLKIKLCPLSPTPFDNKVNPIFIFLAYLSRAWSALKVLNKLHPIDIVYSPTDVFSDIVPAYLFKKRHPQTCWITRIHHLIPATSRPGNALVNLGAFLLQRLAFLCLTDAGDFVLVNNEHLKSYFRKMGIEEKKLKIVGHGIEYGRIRKTKIVPGTKAYHAVFLGRLHQTKGVFDLVPIWKEVARQLPEATLAVIGNGTEEIESSLKKQIRKAGLEENIRLLGFTPHGGKLFSLLKKAEVFIFSDHEAGWGGAAAEAMAAGLPVVGYDIGVLGDVFKKGYLTVPPFNQKQFGEKMVILLKNEKKRKKLSREAFLQAKEMDWGKTARKFFAVLKEAPQKT